MPRPHASPRSLSLYWKGVIDTRSCKLETKHSRASFEAAMEIAGVMEPGACIFCDDSVKNICAAKSVGWRTVLVGLVDRDSGVPIRCDAADVHIATLHELPEHFPELMGQNGDGASSAAS